MANSVMTQTQRGREEEREGGREGGREEEGGEERTVREIWGEKGRECWLVGMTTVEIIIEMFVYVVRVQQVVKYNDCGRKDNIP